MSDLSCPFCPDGHRRPGSRPMAVIVGPERDSDGQPITLHVTYCAGHHVSEHEAQWLRDLINTPDRLAAEHYLHIIEQRLVTLEEQLKALRQLVIMVNG